MQKIIRNAEFIVAPSVCTETFGLSNGESIKLGVPVITTSLGAFPETVNGTNGILVEPGNDQELTTRIDTLWNSSSLIKQLRNGCKATKLMTVEEYVNNLIEIYR